MQPSHTGTDDVLPALSTYRGTKMNTLSAAYQFTADAFRHFIIRTLTDDIPPDGVEKEIARFILRHPAFNGGWLLFLAAEIHERSRTHNSITVTVDENSPHIPGDAYNTHPRTPGRKN